MKRNLLASAFMLLAACFYLAPLPAEGGLGGISWGLGGAAVSASDISASTNGIIEAAAAKDVAATNQVFIDACQFAEGATNTLDVALQVVSVSSTNTLDVALRALTNTAGSVNNSGNTFIQDAVLDANGNITSWVSAEASGGGGTSTNYRGARTTVTTRNNLNNGTMYAVQLDATNDTFYSWDSEGWIDAANEEIDLPETGIYEINASLKMTGLKAATAGQYVNLDAYLGFGTTTNRITVGSGLYPQTASTYDTFDFSHVFDVTSTPAFVYLQIRVYDGAANSADVSAGDIEIRRIGEAQGAAAGGADYTNAMRGALNGYYMRYATPTSVYISSGSIDVGGSYVSKSTSDTLQLNTVLTTDNSWIWICVSNSSTDASTVYHLSTNSHSVAWSTNNAGLYLDSARVVNAILSTQSVATVPFFHNDERRIVLSGSSRGYYFYQPVNWMFAKDQNPSGAWQLPDEIDSETVLPRFTKLVSVGFLAQDFTTDVEIFFTDYDSGQLAGDLYSNADYHRRAYRMIIGFATVDFDIGADLSIVATGQNDDDNEISYGWQSYEIWVKED